jgi:hypothetical protein
MDSHKGKRKAHFLPSVISWHNFADNIMAGEHRVFTRFFGCDDLPPSKNSPVVTGANAAPSR